MDELEYTMQGINLPHRTKRDCGQPLAFIFFQSNLSDICHG